MWTLVDGAIAEPVESFDEKYPHCLPASDLEELLESQKCEVDDDCTSTGFTTCNMSVFECEDGAGNTEYALEQSMVQYLVGIGSENNGAVWYAPGYYDDDAMEYTYEDIADYGEELPLYVDRYANLCSNIYDVDEATARVLYAAADGQFEADAALITADTAPEDYPENVANLMTFLTEDDWNFYTENQLQVDGEDENGDACTECVGFSSFWDFLSAVAKVPAFCNGNLGASYARFGEVAMCAKEFSSLVAVYITQTGTVYNGLTALTYEDGSAVPNYLSGGQVTEETRCASDHENYDATWCAELGYSNYDTADQFYMDKVNANGSVSDDNDYYPRGAGYVMGLDQYYWMSQVIYGDDTLIEDPTLLATDPVTFWLAGLKTWMIPSNGLPAPHNIITGQWEPTDDELDIGLSDGMGAVSSLLYGAEQCGMSQHPVANTRTEIYEDLIASIAAEDGSWTAADTIYDWEDSGCESVARESFPYGDYAQMPQFAVATVNGAQSDQGCFVTTDTTDYIIWKKDAFRDCVTEAMTARR